MIDDSEGCILRFAKVIATFIAGHALTHEENGDRGDKWISRAGLVIGLFLFGLHSPEAKKEAARLADLFDPHEEGELDA